MRVETDYKPSPFRSCLVHSQHVNRGKTEAHKARCGFFHHLRLSRLSVLYSHSSLPVEMSFEKSLEVDSQLIVLSFLGRDSLDVVQLTCRYLRDFVDGITSLPLRQLAHTCIRGNDGSTL